MNQLPDAVDVLIVGLGPVGAALANLLGRYGVDALVIDKSVEIFQAPRAIALDNEALRVLQMCGLQDGDIDTVAIPEVRMHCRHFGQFGRAVTTGAVDGHPKLVTFFQPQLEQVLRHRLQDMASIQVRLGCELLALEQAATHVMATIRSGAVEQEVRARYVVGADGANSLVRRLLGKDFKGKTYAEDWLVVDAKHVPVPIDHVEFICDASRPIPHMVAPGGRQRWEFKLRSGETREQMEDPDMVRSLLRPWSQGGDIEIERVAVYRFHARLADSFQSGRVFLVGDAAHITPPFVGQGLVAGLRDVANLGWKLAWVMQGRAGPALLDSYDRERRPHVRAMINLARMMGQLVMPSSHVKAFFVHGVMKTLAAVPRLRRLFENLEIKPANRFKQGCFVRNRRGRRLLRGGQVPQAWLRQGQHGMPTLSDDAMGSGFCIVGFGVEPSTGLPPELVRRWRDAGGRFVRIDPRGTSASTGASASWEDLGGALMPGEVPVGWVAVVRPDKTVMHDGPLADAAAILRECLGLFATEAGGSVQRPWPAAKASA
jgi:3-(3-hydroxy-phenyl)propionate hydroxylase